MKNWWRENHLVVKWGLAGGIAAVLSAILWSWAGGYVQIERWGGVWNVTRYPVTFEHNGIKYDCVPRENPRYYPNVRRQPRDYDKEAYEAKLDYHRDRIHDLNWKLREHEDVVDKLHEKYSAMFEMVRAYKEKQLLKQGEKDIQDQVERERAVLAIAKAEEALEREKEDADH